MLIKKELERLPLTPGPKPAGKVMYSAGAALHDLPRSGQVLAVDVYNRKKQLLYRFFSDGKNYITWIEQPHGFFYESGWTKRSPMQNMRYSYEAIAADPATIAAIQKGLGVAVGRCSEGHQVTQVIGRFMYDLAWEKHRRAEDARDRLKQEHFAMFPDYPADLAEFCENHVFQQSVLYVSKLEKGKRKAICRHCGKTFKVGREVKPGGSGHCPKCGATVNYRAQWVEKEVVHKVQICVAYRVDGQLLLRYVDVQRVIFPDQRKPQYHFSDKFKALLLHKNGKLTEYAYAWCQAPYRGYDWHRLHNGTANHNDTFVYTNNLREVFGEKYCNVDLQAGLTGLQRPIRFRRLLDNLKDVPQTEYLVKAGLPVLASEDLPGNEARSLPEFIGIEKRYLPMLRKYQANLAEVRLIAGSTSPVQPENLEELLDLNLTGYDLHILSVISRFNSPWRAVRYVKKQKEQAAAAYKRRGISYFIGVYRDYLDMAADLSSDMQKRAVLEPANLKERHDLLAIRIQEQKDELIKNRLPRAIENGLYWWAQPYARNGLCIAYPEQRRDFIAEGQKLNHCVGSTQYYENHIAGQNMIFFIRRTDEADKPYFTTEIEMDTGRIRQLYGFGDCSAPREVRSFTEGFARAVVRWRSQETQNRAG